MQIKSPIYHTFRRSTWFGCIFVNATSLLCMDSGPNAEIFPQHQEIIKRDLQNQKKIDYDRLVFLHQQKSIFRIFMYSNKQKEVINVL